MDTREAPIGLRPFLAHGVEIPTTSVYNDNDNAQGTCPFCGGAKFFVHKQTAMWDCKSGKCKRAGGVDKFLQDLWSELCLSPDEATDGEGRWRGEQLSDDRELLSVSTLKSWGVVWSPLIDRWLIPGYKPNGNLWQLYRRLRVKDEKSKNGDENDNQGWKWRDCQTPGPEIGPELFGVNLYDANKSEVYLCEGSWDGMVLWEVVKGKANVLAVPGAGIFYDRWAPLFYGKIVHLMYDNDYWSERVSGEGKGKIVMFGGGYEGMRRVTGILSNCTQPPKSIDYLHWGPNGANLDLPDGYDVRDQLTKGGRNRLSRTTLLSDLTTNLTPVPISWTEPKVESIAPDTCKDWGTLTDAWRKAMKWTEGLDKTLSIMLSTIASTTMTDDQLWLRVIGAPSSGKSEMCKALAVSKKYSLLNSVSTGFHSGYMTEDRRDHSLLSRCRNKTLITKDGDPLLQNPNLRKILSQGRDIYDTVSNAHYGNSIKRDYEGYRMTWILCGTDGLRMLDSSELGERFIDCEMDQVDESVISAINRRVAMRIISNRGLEANCKAETSNSPAMVQAMRLTGGYVEYLRENGGQLRSKLDSPSDEVISHCDTLSRLVADLRARPSKRQDEKASKEMPYRVNAQLVKLALCLSIVLNKDRVDNEVMRRVCAIAFDTCGGRSMKIVGLLRDSDNTGRDVESVCMNIGDPDGKETKKLLKFMREVDIIRVFFLKGALKIRPRVKLTERFVKLYDRAMKIRDQLNREKVNG